MVYLVLSKIMMELSFHMQNQAIGMCNEAKLNIIVLSDEPHADHNAMSAR